MATESVDRPKVRITYNRSERAKRYSFLRLPFVGGKSRETHCWNLPAAQDYDSGCRVGTTAAQMLLKYYRADGVDSKGGVLQAIVLSMIAAGAPQGEIIGFFSELEKWLRAAACALGTRLDEVGEADLVKTMEHAINETPAEALARIEAVYGFLHDERLRDATLRPVTVVQGAAHRSTMEAAA